MPTLAQDLVFPLRLDPDTGALRQVPQDSQADVRSCIGAILRMPQGHLPELPDFGTPELVFSRQTLDVAGVIRAAVAPWEPRVALATDDTIRGALRDVVLTAQTHG